MNNLFYPKVALTMPLTFNKQTIPGYSINWNVVVNSVKILGRKRYNTMSKRLNFIKYPGGSYYTAPWIVENFPVDYEKMKYVETHLGGGSVFFYKKPSITEILNDLNTDLINLFKFARDYVITLQKCLKSIIYSEIAFKAALEGKYSSEINTYIKYRMSRGGNGKSFAWSDRTRGGIPGDVNGWNNAIEKLPLIQDRLKNTVLCTYSAFDLIQYEDGPNTLFFCDPPWLSSTRVSKNLYEDFEMSDKDHEELAGQLNQCRGKVALLGYKSDLYDRLYTAPKWRVVEKEQPTHAGQNKKKSRRMVRLWLNY